MSQAQIRRPGQSTIDARVIHRSRNLVHAEVVLARDDGHLIAKATATQAILRP